MKDNSKNINDLLCNNAILDENIPCTKEKSIVIMEQAFKLQKNKELLCNLKLLDFRVRLLKYFNMLCCFMGIMVLGSFMVVCQNIKFNVQNIDIEKMNELINSTTVAQTTDDITIDTIEKLNITTSNFDNIDNKVNMYFAVINGEDVLIIAGEQTDTIYIGNLDLGYTLNDLINYVNRVPNPFVRKEYFNSELVEIFIKVVGDVNNVHIVYQVNINNISKYVEYVNDQFINY